MAMDAISYDVTFRDFQFLQGYMARRVFARNKKNYAAALAGVVLCAIFLVTAIIINISPYRTATAFGFGIRYPLSFYLLLIFCLIAAILCLIPAVGLRLKTLRHQVSDNGPLLGSTKLIIESDGLTIDRALMKTKYLWQAFQGVEIAKNAVILPVDNGIGVIIPAFAFSSDTERYDLVAAVAKRLDER
jgi:hypothetical protein